VTLRNSATGQPIDDEEVRRKFQQFGDVKSIRPMGDARNEYACLLISTLTRMLTLFQSTLRRIL
jgi:hypothetical protein